MIKATTLKEDNNERRHRNRRNHEVLLEQYEARQNPPPPRPAAASTAVVHSSPSKKRDWRKFFEDKLKALKKITLAKPDDFMTLLNTIATITDERDHEDKDDIGVAFKHQFSCFTKFCSMHGDDLTDDMMLSNFQRQVHVCLRYLPMNEFNALTLKWLKEGIKFEEYLNHKDQLISEFTNLALEIKINKKRSSNDSNPSDSSAVTGAKAKRSRANKDHGKSDGIACAVCKKAARHRYHDPAILL
eukprot:Awhi_evm2s3035